MSFIFRLIVLGLMAYGAWQLWQNYDLESWYKDCRDAKIRTKTCFQMPAKRGEPRQQTPTFHIKNNCAAIEPAEIQISRGQKVVWQNDSKSEYQIIGSGFETGIIAPGKEYSKVFIEKETIEFSCDYGSGRGKLIIK